MSSVLKEKRTQTFIKFAFVHECPGSLLYDFYSTNITENLKPNMRHLLEQNAEESQGDHSETVGIKGHQQDSPR